MNIRYSQFLCFLGFSAITMLGSGLIADSARGGELIIKHPASEAKKTSEQSQSPCSKLNQNSSTDENKKSLEFQGKRIELFYYRNAENVVELINKLPLAEKGCAKLLPADALESGRGVGRGGGNIVFLYGTKKYIERAHRVIAPLDLPLPGIALQLWGVQISSKKPDKLANVMVDVREEISVTQQLVRNTLLLFQLEAKRTLTAKNKLDDKFIYVANDLGYGEVMTTSRRFSILDVFLMGKVVKNPSSYYQELYEAVVDGEIVDGRFKASDERYQPYFDAMRKKDSPPFERLFRSRGLKPDCKYRHRDDNKCEKWDWKEIYLGSVESIENANNKATLEFAFQYADFTSNPNKYNPAELQRTSQILNSEVQQFTSLLQKDIEDLLIRPTLTSLQKKVADARGVSLAQVGRTTIATLSGVETEINSRSSSTFEIPQSPGFQELLTRAQELQGKVKPFVPTIKLPEATEATEKLPEATEATEATEIISAGPLPISQLIGLIVALTDQKSEPIEIETGTNLTFTPGVLRDLNSAELNIHLTVIDPTFPPTQAEDTVNISSVGKQEVKTTVYTQAWDFFDLSTFTSQATLNGGRGFFPVIGQLWRSIFGSIPVLGDLFSFQRNPQNVLHESLLLTNSFITPTSYGLGLLYPVADKSIYQNGGYCVIKVQLNKYLDPEYHSSVEEVVPSSTIEKNRRTFEELNDKEKKRYLSPEDIDRCTKKVKNNQPTSEG